MWITAGYLRLLRRVWPSADIVLEDRVYRGAQASFQTVNYTSSNGVMTMEFCTPNALCRYRVDTFATKEPETLEWMDNYGGGVLYDVGANIGLFSVFYAKRFESQVYAFEPSVLNLALLAKNVSRNSVSDKVVLVPMPLSDDFKMAEFRLSMLDEGGSMSDFGTESDVALSSQPSELVYATWGLPLDAVIEAPFSFSSPSLLKIDVDGLDDLVLMGGRELLRSKSLESVLIEVDEGDSFKAERITEILTNAGLTFVEKRRSTMFDGGPFERTYNQIWDRKV